MQKQPIEFKVEGLTLRGNIYLPDLPKKLAVLFLHGWTGVTNELAAKMLAENGYYAMTFSLSGHNDSQGRLEDQTRDKSLKEIVTAYDLFKSKLPPDAKIGAVGNSYGGYLAAVLSSKRPIAFIQMRVPANYTDDDSDKLQMGQGSENPQTMKWRHLQLSPEATVSLRALRAFDGPVQILEAELDDHVPHQAVQNYLDAISDKSKLEYHLMAGWPHSLGEDPERNRQYQQMLLDWVKKVELSKT